MSNTIKTESVMIQNLCTPCACRCRHCLLSWEGRLFGVPWERGTRFAEYAVPRIREARPELKVMFAFGPSMEHPRLFEAIRFLRGIGSPHAEFLQCDGMRMRDESECAALAEGLAKEGLRALNFTFYGLPEYHDRFSGRRGDHALLVRMLRAAVKAGLDTSVGVMLTAESAREADALCALLREAGAGRTALIVPHEEGRGRLLEPIRFSERELPLLAPETRALLNESLFRPEREWLAAGAYREETRRSILISLTAENIDEYENADPAALVASVEAADDAYYAAFPPFSKLAEEFGDPEGGSYYRARDLFYHYRRLYAEKYGVSVPDIMDERFTGSRRY